MQKWVRERGKRKSGDEMRESRGEERWEGILGEVKRE